MSKVWSLDLSGDAYEILPTLKTDSYDLVLVDPPYDLRPDQQKFLHKHFLRLSRGTVIVFAPPENQWIQPASQYLFWIKPISTKNTSRRYSRFVEMMFVYNVANNEYWYPHRNWSQYTNVFTDLVDDSSLHPFRKPPSLIERLIENHTTVGGSILDPFAGSYVVAEVARRLGRYTTSIEIEN